MNAGLILAGGRSERLIGRHTPKQFIQIGCKPLISYCLDIFEQYVDIALICVVVDDGWRKIINGDYVFADPGKSRQESIRNGLLALKKYNPVNVVIHDAARPLVTIDDIAAVVQAAHNYDGATPALDITDTIYQSIDGKTISRTLNRDVLFSGQTPECYNFKKYLSANDSLTDNELSNIRGSSEAAVKAGMKIALCNGNPNNFKVTTNADLERFRTIVEDK